METDYSKIAKIYDNNPVRKKYIDPEIGRLLKKKQRLAVLDLACGTGSYLKAQSDAYGFDGIEWIGLDKSPDMLAIAREKNPAIRFVQSAAEECPESLAGGVDYIRNEFAFHHFVDKQKAARNIRRMLVPGGLFIMRNICPEYMKNYWVYSYFPASRNEDRKRFLPVEELYRLFTDNSFTVELKVSTAIRELDYAAAMEEARNRDISQLALISDEEYEKGMALLERDGAASKRFIMDHSLLTLRAG